MGRRLSQEEKVDGWKFGQGVLVTDERRQIHYGQYYRSRTEHIPNNFRVTENAYRMSKHLPRSLMHAVAWAQTWLTAVVVERCGLYWKRTAQPPRSVLACLSDYELKPDTVWPD